MFINNKSKGVVLLSVLMVILLLSSIAAFIGNKYFISLKRFAYLEYQTQAINYYRGIESISIKRIKDELEANKKYLPRNHPLLNNSFTYDANPGFVKTSVKDISNCININSIVSLRNNQYEDNEENINRLKKYFMLKEIEEIYIDEFIDQVIDWIDKDSDPRANGVEDYYYTGPLTNPKHYSGMRFFYDLSELKPLPITNIIGWDNIYENLCAIPITEQSYININSLEEGDGLLLASAFENLSLNDAEYIIFNMPSEGYDEANTFFNNFSNIDFGDVYTRIEFSSNKFQIISELKVDDFSSKSLTTIYYGNNRHGDILSRTYNGI